MAISLQTDMEAFTYRYQHAKNKLTWHVPTDVLAGGRFLDVGCGTGNGVAAAATLGAGMSIGIDRDLCEFGGETLREYPAICAELGVDVRRTLLVEGDIFTMRFAPGSFDCAMMLDTAEHVPDPAAFIRFVHNMLRPGGYFVLDTCPLYYSQLGAHLWNFFPGEQFPWVHLWTDFEALARERNIDSWTWQRFNELNKVTHDDLRAAMLSTGFAIVHEHRSTPAAATCEAFERVKDRIKPEYRDFGDRLFEDWVLLVAMA